MIVKVCKEVVYMCEELTNVCEVVVDIAEVCFLSLVRSVSLCHISTIYEHTNMCYRFVQSF